MVRRRTILVCALLAMCAGLEVAVAIDYFTHGRTFAGFVALGEGVVCAIGALFWADQARWERTHRR